MRPGDDRVGERHLLQLPVTQRLLEVAVGESFRMARAEHLLHDDEQQHESAHEVSQRDLSLLFRVVRGGVIHSNGNGIRWMNHRVATDDRGAPADAGAWAASPENMACTATQTGEASSARRR